jgi:5'-nucleotidase (lipoprotein e(P4) family)
MTSRCPPAFVLTLALTASCRSASPTATPRAPAPPPPAPAAQAPGVAFRPPAAIRWSRDSAAARAAGSWAVVLDADETVLDNSLYMLERAQAGVPFNTESWRAWCTRREATPLPGAAAFLSRVRALGGRIAIVTNRTMAECPDTEAVFLAQGLAYDVMLCKPDGGPSDKTPRFEAVTHGTTSAGLPPLEIVAFIGDNILDFPGQSQAIRGQGDEAFAAFGARFFVLPNPMYGSWERN